jgi:hypothetical protein
MRGLWAGLVVMSLVAGTATAAMALPAGSGGLGDPLQLAATGTLIPYFNAAPGDVTFLEIASPVTAIFNGHLIFYNATCQRGNSQNFPLTVNDVRIVDTRASAPGVNGIVAFASSSNNNDLVPLLGQVADPSTGDLSFSQNTGVHTKAFWINATTGRTRVLEPIILQAAEYIDQPVTTWSSLRTGGTFFALPEGTTIKSTLYLICPRQTIQASTTTSAIQAFNTGNGFPAITPSFLTAYVAGSITGRIYNLDEIFVQDIVSDCDCNQIKPLATLSTGYTDGTLFPSGTVEATYTEIHSQGPDGTASQDFAFTGYRATDITTAPTSAFFGLWERISNGSRTAIRSDTFITTGRR